MSELRPTARREAAAAPADPRGAEASSLPPRRATGGILPAFAGPGHVRGRIAALAAVPGPVGRALHTSLLVLGIALLAIASGPGYGARSALDAFGVTVGNGGGIAEASVQQLARGDPARCPGKGAASGPGTERTPAASASAVPNRTLEWKIGQMLMAGVAGTALGDDARHVLRDLQVGNVVLMGPNVESPEQVRILTRDLQGLALAANGRGLLIATDQEGGRVQRLRDGFTRLPPAAAVGGTARPDLTWAYGYMVGSELRAVGVNMDLAPVLDVNDNPLNPVIGDRAFGTAPGPVEAAATMFMSGLHDAGVAATGKHFPGHGNTSTDSHYTLPVVFKDRAALEHVELRPFRAAIAAGVDAIMLAHVVYPALDRSGLPATVSHEIATCLLRDALGFDGVIVTDDMGMAGIAAVYSPEDAAVEAVRAGADIVLCARLDLPISCRPEMLGQLRAGLLQGVADGRLSLARIDESVRRIEALKERYRVGPPIGTDLSMVASPAHQRIVDEVLAAGQP